MTRHAKFTSKGQITIPVDVRRALGFKDGDTVRIEVEADGVKLKPMRSARELIGIAGQFIKDETLLATPWPEVRRVAWERHVAERVTKWDRDQAPSPDDT
jgi:AbrB family looped-hinge helix DNA binding protein